ncbi:MAG: UbiA family prenyltransferase [Bacteroidetes bacterium]|nr:UbiA family prenyltransferase [Bacteroidota bacterium]
MISKATWLHLRIPFSLFLLPVFAFAAALSFNITLINIILTFLCLHLFIYPASNGYNSYFDKDQDSIGGLKYPPPVSRELYYTALVFDVMGIFLGLMINWQFALMLFIYGLVSKAYSHPSIRLKKYPISGWITAGLFQGFFTFFMAYIGINDGDVIQVFYGLLTLAAVTSTLLLWGSFPMTQIYQHQEDTARGDKTLSLMLGIKGTFLFTALMFGLANLAFIYFFIIYFSWREAITFQSFLLPILGYFVYWYWQATKDPSLVDFDHTMKLNIISAVCMNSFFLVFYFMIH